MRGFTRRGVSAAMVLMLLAGCVLLAESPVAASTSAISNKLLKLADLPAGWSVDNSFSGASTTFACLASLKKAPKGVRRASVSYLKGSSVPELSETLETGSGSAKRWSALNRGLSKCKTFSVQQNGQTAKGS